MKITEIYASLIKKGKKSLEDVPKNLREAVQALITDESEAQTDGE